MKTNIKDTINHLKESYSTILNEYFKVHDTEERKRLTKLAKETNLTLSTSGYLKQKKIILLAKRSNVTTYSELERGLISTLLLIENLIEQLEANTFETSQKLESDLVDINSKYDVETLSKDELYLYGLLTEAKDLLINSLERHFM